MRKFTLLFVVVVLALGLAACGGGGGDTGGGGEAAGGSEASSGGGGDVAAGEELFNQKLVGTQPGCVTCHSLEEGVQLVGPPLANIATEAGERVEGQSAEEYLRASITDPDVHVVEGFAEGTMPAALSDELSEEQVDDLVAFLMTLQ